MFTGIGLIAFGCIFGAASFGLFLGHCLSDERRSDPTRKAVQKLMTVIGILSALVMGLLIADSKANFELRNREVEQFAASYLRDLRAAQRDGRRRDVYQLIFRGGRGEFDP
jgi:predicted LPLAT superfamily acyltransferase